MLLLGHYRVMVPHAEADFKAFTLPSQTFELSTMTLAYWHLRAEKISEYPK
jgi:hypothetical protein